MKFLKSVTTCTSCGQKGHWFGDETCPNAKKRPGQKSASPKKKPTGSQHGTGKKTTFFVLHDKLESEDETGDACFIMEDDKAVDTLETFAVDAVSVNVLPPVSNEVSRYDMSHDPNEASQYDMVHDSNNISKYNMAPVSNEAVTSNAVFENAVATELEQANVDHVQTPLLPSTKPSRPLTDEPNAQHVPVAPPGYIQNSENQKTLEEHYGNGARITPTCFTSTLTTSTHEVLMVLKDTQLCAHSSYLGGKEREYHRGANGHTRHITCKDDECNKTVISAKRKDPAQLWRYLVQVALCTLWGRAARSRELFSSVCRVREQALQEREERAALRPPPGYPGSTSKASPTSSPSKSSASLARWDMVSASGSEDPRTAKIVRPGSTPDGEPRFWVYGVLVAPGVDLPCFPTLAPDDVDILQPLPSDNTPCGPETPFAGYTYSQVASSPEAAIFCHQTLIFVLEDNPAVPEIYRLAFYLFGRVKLLHSAVTRMWKAGEFRPAKRPASPDEMIAHRCIRVPLCFNLKFPDAVQIHDFEVMMVDDNPNPSDRLDLEALASDEQDPPGLAILDSGCTRTMHGKDWADLFEAELGNLGLSSRRRLKKQSFKGVGGQITSDTVKIFPVGINRVNGELHSAEAPGGLPLLLSRPFMEELQTVINIGSRTVSFNKIGVIDLPLIRTKKGHLAVSLLDFDLTDLDQYESPHPTQETEETFGLEPEEPGCLDLQQDPDYLDYIQHLSHRERCEIYGYDGENPDDVDDDDLANDLLRMEVEGRQAALQRDGPPLEHLDPLVQGELCEDVNFIYDNPDLFMVRKTTNKKFKKFEAWQASLWSRLATPTDSHRQAQEVHAQTPLWQGLAEAALCRPDGHHSPRHLGRALSWSAFGLIQFLMECREQSGLQAGLPRHDG